jgi:hypothetical protein
MPRGAGMDGKMTGSHCFFLISCLALDKPDFIGSNKEKVGPYSFIKTPSELKIKEVSQIPHILIYTWLSE